MRAVDNVLELIGGTPIVKLRRVTEGLDAEIYAKLEYLNPTGSLKDRIALEMIRRAEEEGKLKPGYTIVEASTGNTGISLSMVGRSLGYRVAIYMPEGTTPERVRIMESYGAEVHLVKLRGGPRESLAGAEVEIPTREICLDLERSNPRVWWARQFSNPANTSAHIKTGEEILEQLGCRVDAFVASVGTGGTLLGVARALRGRIPEVRIVAVEPTSAEYPLRLGYRRVPGASEEVTGGIVEEILDGGVLDEVIQVSNEEAIAMSERLAREEGLFAGISGGANVHASIELARRLGKKRIATVLPDSGDRYLTEKRYIT